MNPLIREAVYITRDFETATFVGAIAVMLHVGTQHQSRDLDFGVAEQITRDEFLKKGYRIVGHNDKKFTPRGYKIDVYDKRNLNDIPLEYIVNTATTVTVDKKGTTVNVISLEGLIIAKFRAGRDQDIVDLQRLSTSCNSRINWDEIKNLAKNDIEYSNIKQIVHLYTIR